jgi:hypothetical protein
LKKSFTPLFSFPNEIPARKMHENVNWNDSDLLQKRKRK